MSFMLEFGQTLHFMLNPMLHGPHFIENDVHLGGVTPPKPHLSTYLLVIMKQVMRFSCHVDVLIYTVLHFCSMTVALSY